MAGTYVSDNSLGGGDAVKGKLKGYVAGDVISFTVLWPGGSITSWVGQMVDDKDAPRIKTLWLLVTDIPYAKEEKKLGLRHLRAQTNSVGKCRARSGLARIHSFEAVN